MESIFKSEDAEIPSVVYKFGKSELIGHLLEHRTALFRSTSRQNDINENLWDYSALVERQINILNQDIELSYRSNSSHFQSREDFDFLFGANRFAESFVNLRIYRQIQKLMSGIGAICFSASCENSLMWAHYADSSAGICVGISSEARFLKEATFCSQVGLRRVCYSDQRVKISPQNIEESFLDIIYTKSKDWAYESELRAVCDLPDGQDQRLFPIEPEEVREVIVSVGTPLEDILRLEKLANVYPHVAIAIAVPDTESFRNVILPLPNRYSLERIQSPFDLEPISSAMLKRSPEKVGRLLGFL
ncbi:MAG: DUF2971 domain-containing protein [Armatimonadetes bacterium]|nr:DUF2971 domain-containing protein [Armatimonadota bacterium]